MKLINSDKFENIEYTESTGPIPRNERDAIINEFTKILQKEFIPYYIKAGKKIKVSPWTLKRVVIKLAPIKNIRDLYYLMSVCKQSDNFTAMFHWLTNPKNIK